MSTIVSPVPVRPYDPFRPCTPGAAWWRLRLQPNADGNTLVMRTDWRDDDPSTATWISYEFFDGYDTIIDAGLDRPTVDEIRITHHAVDHMWALTRAVALDWHTDIDMLHAGPPTPGDWRPLTMPDDYQHPADRQTHRPSSRYPYQLAECTPNRSRVWSTYA